MEQSVDLSESQRAIVEGDRGAIVVVASPGSGKTTLLAHRIKHYLESRRGFGRVLAVTFTSVAAQHLRTRVVELCGQELASFVDASTFHGFATRLLNQHGSHLGLVPGFLLANEIEDRIAIASEAVTELNGISPSASDSLRIANEIARFNERASTESQAGDGGDGIKRLAGRYRELSLQYNQLDFSLLIFLATELLRSVPPVAEVLRATYQLICVDEFQDTNDAQFELLKLLVGKQTDGLLLLADQDQVIYGWNGASPERLKEAVTEFDARTVVLPTSYRCPSRIVDVADLLIRHNSNRFTDSRLRSSRPNTGEVNVRKFTTNVTEVAELTEYAEQSLKSSPTESTALLCRTRKMADAVLAFAQQRGLHAALRMGRAEFVSAPVVLIRSVLRSAARSDDRAAFRATVATLELITGRSWDRNEILQRSAAEDLPPLAVLFQIAKSRAISAPFHDLSQYVLESLIERGEYRALGTLVFNWCDYLLETAADRIWADDYLDEKELFGDVERRLKGLHSDGISLGEFVAALESESRPALAAGGLSVLTVHGAKGLEFDNVIVPGLSDGRFPSYFAVKAGSDSDGMREERRSLYVAMTRARKRVVLSYAMSYDGRSTEPSRFLREMELIG